MAINQVRHQGRRGLSRSIIVTPPVGDTYSPVWERPDLQVAIQARIVGFNPALIDTTITAPTRSAGIIYIDPVGLVNGVGTFSSPKNAWVATSKLQANTEYRIKAGTTLNLSNGANTAQWGAVGAHITLCSYDPATGARVLGQPSPKRRALAGQWYTEEERTSKYACIDMKWAPPNAAGATSFPAAIALDSGNTDIVIAGIEFRNWGLAAVVAKNGASVRIEDCIFGMTNHDSRVDNAAYPGGVFRCDGSTGGSFDIVRCFSRTGTMDFFWGGANSTTVPLRFIDNAIIQTLSAIWHGNAHADLFQATCIQDQKFIQGNVFQHTNNNKVNFSTTDALQGRAWVSNMSYKDHPSAALTAAVLAGGGGLTWNNNILISNLGGGYWTGAPGHVSNSGCIMLRPPFGITSGVGGVVPAQGASETHGFGTETGDQSHAILYEEDCVHWLVTGGGPVRPKMVAGHWKGNASWGIYTPTRLIEEYVT